MKYNYFCCIQFFFFYFLIYIFPHSYINDPVCIIHLDLKVKTDANDNRDDHDDDIEKSICVCKRPV